MRGFLLRHLRIHIVGRAPDGIRGPLAAIHETTNCLGSKPWCWPRCRVLVKQLPGQSTSGSAPSTTALSPRRTPRDERLGDPVVTIRPADGAGVRSDSRTNILWSPSSRRRRVATLATTSRTSLICGSSNSGPGDTPLRGRSSPAQRSRREHWPQPLLQRSARKRADHPIDLLPVPDHDQQRDRLRPEPAGESWVRVDIDLHDLDVPRVSLREVFKYRRDQPAGPTPRRPEIDHNRHRCRGLGSERVAVGVDDPRQRGLAPWASRDFLRDRTDAIPRVTRRAADDAHHHQGRTRPGRGRLAPSAE